ncbi:MULTISPECIES: TonB-dependent receptor [Acidobacteriaceae]|uniref:TonB-dependent receptor n=1 Tax=Acidobacteriaceae TaxID=204434 RepID=UPI00131CC86B|nr:MULTISPECIES: TonB-dependent receptor [Acidobacteriaceae]MDW5265207.1 TonB-dependent receptor [Edaphobacter sp.]
MLESQIPLKPSLLTKAILLGTLLFAFSLAATAQTTGGLRGQVLDPSGAVVPGATVTLTKDATVLTAPSGNDGNYSFRDVPAGAYSLTIDAQGFTFPKTDVSISSHVRQMNLTLAIAVQQQNVQVTSKTNGVSLNPDENSGAIVLSGHDLDALSDDPDQLQSELQALAGPSAGPNGGQIYIDGFAGGQLPPKSSIREIRINQNPFSAEFDRLGYGRIEILTKPGTDKLSGYVMTFITSSALNTANPLVQEQPSYHGYSLPAYVAGPLTKHSSYFLNFFHNQLQNQEFVVAVNPADTTTNITQTVSRPSSFWQFNPRFDFQLGKSNTLSIRDSFSRYQQSNAGVGTLVLADNSYNQTQLENDIQISDTVVVNSKLLNETHFQWRKIRNSQTANTLTPTVTVQGAFTTGGNSSGTVQDHQDVFELQNYSTATAGLHTIRFGARLQAYRDANYSTSGSNGTYIFQSLDHYLAGKPDQYQATVIKNPLARVLLFDAALFYQDDWRWKPNLTLSYGLRYEGQNRIHDHADFAPRVALAWAPGHMGSTPPKTVFRAGYGWFYNRFTVPNSFSSATGTPYIMQALHQNGINQQSYVVNNPDFYDPTTPATLNGSNTSLPTVYSIDPHFRAALDMQGGIGMDRAVGKLGTVNVTYLFTRGIHQFLTNNISAPTFDPATYTVTSPTPSEYNYQFQSGGIYKQNQIIVTGNTKYKHISVHTSYTFNDAQSDTQGVTYTPSVASNPSLDYGRASFGIHHRLVILGTYAAPHGIILAPLLFAQSGTPYNLTIGNDLTENNQFNARPTYGTCGAADVVSTPYGCLDTNPIGKGEPIVPYGVGTGPANFVLHMRISKAFGVGPKIKGTTGSGFGGGGGGGSVSGRGLGGAQAGPKLDASVPRKYSLTIVATSFNVLNIVNRGTPNGVLNSTLFGKTQSLAGDGFGSNTGGNRSVFLQAMFNF